MGRGRVEQGGDNSRLAPVQPLKAVDARIGRAQLGPPQSAADSLQGGEHLIEDAANVETTLSMIKMKFGGAVRAKTPTTLCELHIYTLSMPPCQTALGANTTSRLNG